MTLRGIDINSDFRYSMRTTLSGLSISPGEAIRHVAKHGGGERQILLDQPLRQRVHGHEPDFAALAPDPKMYHALAALDVPDPQPAELLAVHAVIEQGGEDGAIARALERVRRRLQQLARLVARRQPPSHR